MIPEYQYQIVLGLLDSLGKRFATLEHTLERNNDLVAALLKANGIVVTVQNGGVTYRDNQNFSVEGTTTGGNETVGGNKS